MAENSKISWTDNTFNPWLGCTKVSSGCDRCYAETLMDLRYGKVKWGPNGTRVKTSPQNWNKPLKWDREAKAAGIRCRVFCASLADVCEQWDGPILHHGGLQLFHGSDTEEHRMQRHGYVYEALRSSDRPPVTMDDLRSDLISLIKRTPNLDWLILTKRADRVLLIPPLPNVWMGVTIEGEGIKDGHGDFVDSRWRNYLMHINQYAVRWISYEPALARLPIENWAVAPDWIIFGGESDQSEKARAFDIAWLRDGLAQCRNRGIVPFVKQMGSFPVERKTGSTFHFKDKAGADPDEWDREFVVQEFPMTSSV